MDFQSVVKIILSLILIISLIIIILRAYKTIKKYSKKK